MSHPAWRTEVEKAPPGSRLPALPLHAPGARLAVLEGPTVEGPMSQAHRAAVEWLLQYRDNENTARSYARVLEAWFGFCESFGVDPLSASRQLVERYKAGLFDRGLKPTTVTQRLSTLSSWYRYCSDEGLLAGRNPLLGVRRPKLPDEASSTGLTKDELNSFLAEARRRGPMMHALMLLLAMNGLRSSEPLPVTVDDLGTMRGHATISLERKGHKGSQVKVPLAPVTAAAVEAWMTERAQLLGQAGRGSGLLFFGFRRGTGDVRELDRRDVFRWVKSIGRVGVPNKPSLHPHDLRHAFITLSLDAGVPLRDVQDSAGHASANTTRRYDRGRNNIDRHATYVLAGFLSGEH